MAKVARHVAERESEVAVRIRGRNGGLSGGANTSVTFGVR